MPNHMIMKFLLTLSLILFVQNTSANLLINPTRVQFNPADRTADVTLINTSTTTNTYRIEWAEKKAKPTGGYIDLNSNEAANFAIASNMLRHSPKQVTLKAGERQTIKLALRRPQNLSNGEYRSHLLFKALPPPTPEETENKGEGSTVVNIVLSFAIPVVVRQGSENYELTLNDAAITYNPSQKNGSVILNMSRQGITSTFGNISAYWTPSNGQERLIAKIGDYSFWPELSNSTLALAWVGADFAPADGKLRVVYEGVKDFRGKTFFNKTFTINRSMIKTAN